MELTQTCKSEIVEIERLREEYQEYNLEREIGIVRKKFDSISASEFEAENPKSSHAIRRLFPKRD